MGAVKAVDQVNKGPVAHQDDQNKREIEGEAPLVQQFRYQKAVVEIKERDQEPPTYYSNEPEVFHRLIRKFYLHDKWEEEEEGPGEHIQQETHCGRGGIPKIYRGGRHFGNLGFKVLRLG